MTARKLLLPALAILLLGAVALGLWGHARDRAQARAVWQAPDAARESAPPYDPAMVAGLPEVAQRYFARTIEPGTPLHRTVRLEMEGTFVLNGTEMPMVARQILGPPAHGFVWQAEIGRGLMRFGGSDGYHRSDGRVDSWTKFWLNGLIPLARIGGTEDHARAAAIRVMLEAIWAPATLLPQYGARWTYIGPDSAEIRFADADGIPPMHITLDATGALTEVQALRWTDANPEGLHRLQPFGGLVLEMGRHQGFLIPVRVELGNMYGTPEHSPFFRATITAAAF